MSQLSYTEFTALLYQGAGADNDLRLQLINEYDANRKAFGLLRAEEILTDRVVSLPAETILKKLALNLKDEDAKKKINNILKEGANVYIPIANKLNSKLIKKAINWQSCDEGRVRRLANQYKPEDQLRIRRYLRREAKQATSTINLTLGLIGSGKSKHCSPHEIDMRNQQKSRWRSHGERTNFELDGQTVNLLDIMDSAHRSKLAETHTIIKGIEAYGKNNGLDWAFGTITCPPRMHSNPEFGKNTWDGTTPKEAHKWLLQQYHRVEARLRKKNILISGFWVPEPHKDGCPHWHFLIFANPSDMAEIESTFKTQTQSWHSEKGCKLMLNNGTASASSYVSKYVLKSLSNAKKLEGELASVDSWRSTWGIPGLHFFGIPKISQWRHFRSLKTAPEEPLLASMWKAVKGGDAAEFISLAGGLNVKSKDRPVHSKMDSTGATKILTFTLPETGELFIQNSEKWQITVNAKTSNNLNMVGLIPMLPRKPSKTNAEPQPPEISNSNEKQIQPHWTFGSAEQAHFDKVIEFSIEEYNEKLANANQWQPIYTELVPSWRKNLSDMVFMRKCMESEYGNNNKNISGGRPVEEHRLQ